MQTTELLFYQNCVLINAHNRTNYARMDQVKFVEDIL